MTASTTPREIAAPRETPAPPRSVRATLEPWCAAGATGALRILEPDAGSIFLVEGRIAYAESPQAPGFPALVAAADGAPREATALAALFGAVLFQLDVVASTRFDVGVPSPVDGTRALDLSAVLAEVDRRRHLLRDAWPDDRLDVTPVTPVSRLDGHQVALTATQWEIVANAHRGLSPAELARALGRDPFAFLFEVRRLARAGLLVTGGPPVPLALTAAPERERLPRRLPDPRAHPVNPRKTDHAGVPVGTLLRIRRALEEQL